MKRLLLPAALAVVAASLAPVAPTAHADEPSPDRSGLMVSLGPTSGSLVLPGRTAAALAAEGVPLRSGGTGMELGLGWAFNPRFEVGLRVAGTNFDDGDEPRSPAVGQFTLEATTHLLPGRRVNPHLTGGFGGTALGFGKEANEDESIEAATVTLGGGVEVRWARHWGMVFQYRYSALEIDRQFVRLPASSEREDGAAVAGTGPIEVGGDAAVHHFGFSWVFRM